MYSFEVLIDKYIVKVMKVVAVLGILLGVIIASIIGFNSTFFDFIIGLTITIVFGLFFYGFAMLLEMVNEIRKKS